MPGRQLHPAGGRLLVAALGGLLSCKPPPDPAGATVSATARVDDITTAKSPRSRGSQRIGPTPSDPAPLEAEPLPILSQAALQARWVAQRALLPDSKLFEDAHGRPMPWIAPAPEPMSLDVAPSLESDDDFLLSLPGSSGLGGLSESAVGPTVNGNALGLFEPLEVAPDGQGLEAFYDALRNLGQGVDEDGKVRILVYGASHTDADVYPHYLRTYLQERFGDGGHGYVHVAKPWKWYGHFDVEVEGFRHWKTEHAQIRDGRDDGYYGLLGASLATKSRRAFGRVALRRGVVGSRFEIAYLQQPKGGAFRVLVDGERVATVKTRGREYAAGFHTVEVPEATHTVEIQPVGNGEIRMFGMTVERDQPGVVVDTLGIGGTRVTNLLSWDEAVWTQSVQRRDPALVVLAYGTNEASDDTPIGYYEARLREAIARVRRAAPRASCLLVGPGDYPLTLEDGHFAPRPRITSIVSLQAEIAREYDCAFWDTLAFMGGELSMVRWVGAEPQMAKDDHIHLTRRGYVRMGMALVDAIMTGFDHDDPVQFAAGAQPTSRTSP